MSGDRSDPAAWHEERARKALTRQYEGFQLGGRRPEWFEEWFAGKKAEKAATGSLSSYLYDLTGQGTSRRNPCLRTGKR